jgi:hypothetical protein
LREQRLLKHFQSEARHDCTDISDSAVASAHHSFNCRLSHPVDGRSEFRGLTRREQGRERPALNAPVLALGGQQPVAKPGPQDAKLEVVFAVVGGIVEKHASNSRGIMGGGAQPE